jgi:hypothetical protein
MTWSVKQSLICKLLMNRFHGYDSAAYVAWRAGTINRVVAPARQARNPFPGPLKRFTNSDSYEPSWNF